MTDRIERLADEVCAGNRSSLARAVTLIESGRIDHREQSALLLERLRPFSGSAFRIGVSGTPGVGKSTFLDAFGTLLTGQDHRLAVLAVDPSSGKTGGSILADKTRMPRLASDPHAYIRPTPSKGELGGIARTTREAITLMEAAGYDVVIVETVGVGQSETLVADLVDLFLLLMQPGAGDEFQGIKKGILEVADLLVVTKADGSNLASAQEAARVLSSALRLLAKPADASPWVHLVSALENEGLSELWHACELFRERNRQSGAFEARRRDQRLRGFEAALERSMRDMLMQNAELQERVASNRAAVADGRVAPEAAALDVVRSCFSKT